MIELIDKEIIYSETYGFVQKTDERLADFMKESGLKEISELRRNTIAYQILEKHNHSKNPAQMQLVFDSLASHDITYVGIIQSASASGMKEFPVPYTLTNCHNSLCAVGGTINEDDHVFGLSAAKKYGGIYVPANLAVIHQFEREMMAACGSMILGSDSHTRYGALGTLGIGEGGPELVKQLLQKTYDIDAPKVVLVYLENKPNPWVGPQDVAIALIKAVFPTGFVKNKILEFAGPGIQYLPMDFRNGVDVMTTETACLSSIWQTDESVKTYFELHGRPEAYRPLHPENYAYYDSMVHIDLSKIEPMIALPFHPSNGYTIRELLENPGDILRSVETESEKIFGKASILKLTDKIHDGRILADQAIIAGCAGGMFDNLCTAADILDHGIVGNDYFSMSVYPASMPINAALTENGVMLRLQKSGVVTKMPFCGPCFGAGDIPANNGFSIRHTTRNFPNRDGSKPDQGQVTGVALMDARSIAATAANSGYITSAADMDIEYKSYPYHFDSEIYRKRVYCGYKKPQKDVELRYSPNITPWPEMYPLAENLLLVLAAVIRDPVTTTDELIPSGETSSYRSNPVKLADFTLSRRVPEYVNRAKKIRDLESERRKGSKLPKFEEILDKLNHPNGANNLNTAIGSVIFANKPGDGSAREQAASSQKVLGGLANIAYEYATKRYRSNCINWGIIPFTIDPEEPFEYQPGDKIFIPGIRKAIAGGIEAIPAKIITGSGIKDILLHLKGLTREEREIIISGSLINFYARKK